MLTLKARNTYNNIDVLSGGARPLKKGGILAGNDILNGMQGGYSFKNFAHDAGNVYKSIPQPVKDMAMKAATDAAMSAMAAAGRSDLIKGSKKARSVMNKVRGIKLEKGSQEAKDYMAMIRSMKGVNKAVKVAKEAQKIKPLKIKK